MSWPAGTSLDSHRLQTHAGRTASVSERCLLVMVLVVRNGARAADVCLLERDCAAAHSLDALESIDLFLAVILRAAWLLQRHEDWTHDEK